MDTDEDKAISHLQKTGKASLIGELACFAEVFFHLCSSVVERFFCCMETAETWTPTGHGFTSIFVPAR